MLWQRLLFGGLMIAALVGLVVWDGWYSELALPVTALVAVLVVLATLELGRLCRARGYEPGTVWAAVLGAGLVVIAWIELRQVREEILAPAGEGVLAPAGELAQADPAGLLGFLILNSQLSILWLAVGLLGAFGSVLRRKSTEGAVASMAVTLFMVLYLGLLASFAIRIRFLWPDGRGAAMILYFLLTVKSGDIGAYFVGYSMGRRKLIPWLSPGKTVEGAAGAVILAGLVAVAGMLVWNWVPALGPAPLSYLQALVFGALMAVFGHLGDLMESAIKRDVGTKDSGRVVPAFGGLLDIMDSPLFAAPVAWILLTFWLSID